MSLTTKRSKCNIYDSCSNTNSSSEAQESGWLMTVWTQGRSNPVEEGSRGRVDCPETSTTERPEARTWRCCLCPVALGNGWRRRHVNGVTCSPLPVFIVSLCMGNLETARQALSLTSQICPLVTVQHCGNSPDAIVTCQRRGSRPDTVATQWGSHCQLKLAC